MLAAEYFQGTAPYCSILVVLDYLLRYFDTLIPSPSWCLYTTSTGWDMHDWLATISRRRTENETRVMA